MLTFYVVDGMIRKYSARDKKYQKNIKYFVCKLVKKWTQKSKTTNTNLYFFTPKNGTKNF